MSDDYYEILGVEEDASFEEIKRVFRKKARELHPDVNKADNAEEMFKKLNEAHSILSDPNKRKEYDLRRKGIPSFGSGFPGFGDIFNDIFRGGPFHRPPP